MPGCRSAGSFCLLMLMLAATGCAVSQQEEVDIGAQAAPRFEREFGGLSPDPELQRYVNRVGMRVARYAGRADLPWQFRVLNSDVVNAFALPGGYIYVTEGMLRHLKNEAQLASILAHEAAHVAHRHSVDQLERAQLIQGGAALTGLLSGSDLAGDISQIVGGLVMMSYSRDQEKEADLTGLDYLMRAGYDGDAMVEAMRIIGQESGGNGPPEFLSTHPSPEGRIDYLQDAIRARYGDVISAGRSGADDYARYVRRR